MRGVRIAGMGRFVFIAVLIAVTGLGIPAWSGATEMPERPVGAEKRVEKPADRGGKTVLILGVSWHSGFCEGMSRAPECRDHKPDAESARQFSLHGLWRVRKTYCGVPEPLKAQDKKRAWLDMPELALEDTLKAELARAMPGVASGLDRHEWVKHGTCSGDVASDYYARSLKLLAAVNASGVRTLFAENLGRTLDESRIKASFDAAFGPGAGDKVRMRCRKDGDRRVITGLTIGLGVDPDTDTGANGDELVRMIAAAGRTKFGCDAGVVDEAGPQ